MYLSYYNLRHKPFQISTDPGFLWLGEKHMEALATLRYGVLDNKGFLLLTGDVGTGKTTLINALLKSLGEDVLVATIRDPDLVPLDFFQYTAHVFGLKKEITSKISFLIHFEQFLNQAYENKKKVLLIIDEAQRINQKLLEEVRLLSNIERNECKLLNIFFVGQIEFNDILLRPVNRPIRQRITINYNIERLSPEETKHYIKHRLDIASRNTRPGPGSGKKYGQDTVPRQRPSSHIDSNNSLFSDGAINEIYSFSQGYPRLINIICDRSLLTSYVEESKIVLPRHVRECAKELEIPYFGTGRNRKKKDLANSSPQSSASPEPSQQKRQANFEKSGKTKAEEMLPITELAIHNGNSEKDAIDNLRTRKTAPRSEADVYNKGKILKNFSIGAIVLTLIFIGYVNFSQDSGFSTQLSTYLKNSSAVKNAANIWQSLRIRELAGMIGIKNGITATDAEKSDFSGTQIQNNPLLQDEKAAAVSPDPTPETKEKQTSPGLMGKLIMPFPDDATLPPPTSLVNLNMLLESMPPQDSYKVIITGFTDTRKDEKLNRKLSEAKANAIKIYLISRGLEESQMETRGLGSESPIAPNSTTSGREANHRVEVEFHRQ